MLIGTFAYASSGESANIVEFVENEQFSPIIVQDDDNVMCTWCVVAGPNQWCAEAANCEEAKKAARAMALHDLKKANSSNPAPLT